jgi:hypothetical protein
MTKLPFDRLRRCDATLAREAVHAHIEDGCGPVNATMGSQRHKLAG